MYISVYVFHLYVDCLIRPSNIIVFTFPLHWNIISMVFEASLPCVINYLNEKYQKDHVTT